MSPTQSLTLEQKVDLILQKVILIEERLDGVEQRLDRVEQRLDKVEQRLDKVEQRLDSIETRVKKLEKSNTLIVAELKMLRETLNFVIEWLEKFERNITQRVRYIEQKLGIVGVAERPSSSLASIKKYLNNSSPE